MKKYEKYKDSGIEWIGEIPKTWKSTRLKNISTITKGRKAENDFQDFSEGKIPYLSMEYLRNQTENPLYVDKNDKSIVLVNENDLLILWDGSKAGEIVQAKNGALSSTMGKIVIYDDSFDLNFISFYLKNSEKFIQENTIGMGIPHVNGAILKELFFVNPSLSEQIQIARYLDHQTGIIDALIAKKEKLVELLKEKRQAIINEAVTKGLNPDAKMKDSGIEWLGEVPEEWEIKKLKSICEAYGRIGYRGYTVDDIVAKGDGAITISPSNMKGIYMTFENCSYINWQKYEESPEIKIYNDDILMVKTGSTYGKIGIVKNLEEKATINPQLLVFKSILIDNDYLFNLLSSPVVQIQVEKEVVGSTIPTISQTKILNFQIPLPPKSQIDVIHNYIKAKSATIDLQLKFIDETILKLKEYRQSIISEAVTGKVDVRDWQPDKKQFA